MKVQILLATALLAVSALPAKSSFLDKLSGDELDERSSLFASSTFVENSTSCEDEIPCDLEIEQSKQSTSLNSGKKKKTVRFQDPLPNRYQASYPSKMHDGAFAFSPTNDITHLMVEPYKPNKQANPALAHEYPSVEQSTSFAKGQMSDPAEWYGTYIALHGCNPPGVETAYIESLLQLKSQNLLTKEHLPHICHTHFFGEENDSKPVLDSN